MIRKALKMPTMAIGSQKARAGGAPEDSLVYSLAEWNKLHGSSFFETRLKMNEGRSELPSIGHNRLVNTSPQVWEVGLMVPIVQRRKQSCSKVNVSRRAYAWRKGSSEPGPVSRSGALPTLHSTATSIGVIRDLPSHRAAHSADPELCGSSD